MLALEEEVCDKLWMIYAVMLLLTNMALVFLHM
jgi:hypothetical protein